MSKGFIFVSRFLAAATIQATFTALFLASVNAPDWMLWVISVWSGIVNAQASIKKRH